MNLDTYIPISHLEEGNKYNQVFMVSDFTHRSQMVSKDRKPFARATIQDVTGSMNGVIWQYDATQEIRPGAFVRCEVELCNFDGSTEFQTTSEKVFAIEETIPANQYDYFAGVTEETLVAYLAELDKYVNMISDEHYRNLIGYAMSEQMGLMNMLRSTTYGLKGPLAYPGGLLTHVIHSLRFSRVASKLLREQHANINSSLIIVGTMLRNLGWNTTTRFYGNVLRTLDSYHMRGLYRESSRLVNYLCVMTETDIGIDIPPAKVIALDNLCNPLAQIHTLEGRIVAQSDNMADTVEFGGNESNIFEGHVV